MMTTFLAYFIARAIPTVVGAIEIDFAIECFKKEKYFLFGLWTMSACANLVLVAKVIMKG